jgi:hypothetical protein
MTASPLQRLQLLWILWFLALLFHTDLGLMPLFHGQSATIATEVDASRLPLVFWAMLLYALVPMAVLLVNAYTAVRRWRWFQFGVGVVYTVTNGLHLVVDILIPDSRGDQVTLMAVMLLLGLLINREGWRWCRGG